VFVDHGYPAVYWPDHPLARKHGVVRIHRVVARELFGNIPPDYHVHHVNENKWDWSETNLVLIGAGEHTQEHRGRVPERACETCGQIFRPHSNVEPGRFCGRECVRQPTRINWPDVSTLRRLVVEHGYVGAGRQLGVSDNAVRKRLRVHG
jgi:hypothetical protein